MWTRPTSIPRLGVLAAVSLALTVASCGTAADQPGGSSSGVIEIETAFYPLQWMAEQVGGRRVEVSNLTKPGAEPHDLELTPGEVARVSDADVVVYLKGFQPAVDDAAAQADSDAVFDASATGHLDRTYTPIEEGKQQTEEAGTVDPHFWLDPTRLSAVVESFGLFMADLDPDHADEYQANVAKTREQLGKLDHDLKTGLSTCENNDLVTSHNAFGYFAARYGLDQVGIAGLSPDAEPSPADLARVTKFVRQNRVKTIYFETLVSPDLANTVANETGAKTEMLDPIEGLTDQSQGSDYLQVMRSNLENIRSGQPCT